MRKPLIVAGAAIGAAVASYLHFSKLKTVESTSRPDEKTVYAIEQRVFTLFKHIETFGSKYEFKTEYNNGTGYFDPLVRVRPLPELTVVEAAAQNQQPLQFGWMTSDSGRNVYVIDVPTKNRFVLFHRYIGLDTPVIVQISQDIQTIDNPEGGNLFNTHREGFDEVLTMLENTIDIKAA